MCYDTISKREMLKRYDKRAGIVIVGIRTKDIEETIKKYKKQLDEGNGCYDKATLIKSSEDLDSVDCAMTLGDRVPFDDSIGDKMDEVIKENDDILPMSKYINDIRKLAVID